VTRRLHRRAWRGWLASPHLKEKPSGRPSCSVQPRRSAKQWVSTTPEEAALREPYLATTRSQLGEAAWAEALAQGRAMTFEQAIEYAISAGKPSTTPPSSTPEHPAGLTSREVEVLGLVDTGLTSAQVATQLFLSTRTVDTHLTSIYHKLGVTSRAAATRFALEHDLTS